MSNDELIKDIAIRAKVPINKEAAMVTGKGIHYDPKMPKTDIVTLNIRPRVRGKNYIEKNRRNLRGKRFGRFTVIGISSDVPKRWVVKCDCGRFEFRSSKVIEHPSKDGNNDRCQHCLQEKKNINSFRRYEKWLSFGKSRRGNREGEEGGEK